MIATIIILLVFVFWLYKKSRSDYFLQEKKVLKKKYEKLILPLLIDFGFKTDNFTRAYFYFIDNPKDFDGATIVADNWQVNHLDLCAMVHDYSYIVLAKGIKDRLKFDWEYSQNMRKFKVNWFTAYSRWFLLLLLNVSGIYSLSKFMKNE